MFRFRVLSGPSRHLARSISRASTGNDNDNFVALKASFSAAYEAWLRVAYKGELGSKYDFFDISWKEQGPLFSMRPIEIAYSNTEFDITRAYIKCILSDGRTIWSMKNPKAVQHCLRFFEWIGEQPGFSHASYLYIALYNVFTESQYSVPPRLTSLLTNLGPKQPYRHRFYETLLLGYDLVHEKQDVERLQRKIQDLGMDFRYVNGVVTGPGFPPIIDAKDIQLLLQKRQYSKALKYMINMQGDRPFSLRPESGNCLLTYCLESADLYNDWIRLRDVFGETHGRLLLDDLLFSFTKGTLHPQHMERAIHRCFLPNVESYNLLLRRLLKDDQRLDDQKVQAILGLFSRMFQNAIIGDDSFGSFDIFFHGLCKHRREIDAHRWLNDLEKMVTPGTPWKVKLITWLRQCQINGGFRV